MSNLSKKGTCTCHSEPSSLILFCDALLLSNVGAFSLVSSSGAARSPDWLGHAKVGPHGPFHPHTVRGTSLLLGEACTLALVAGPPPVSVYLWRVAAGQATSSLMPLFLYLVHRQGSSIPDALRCYGAVQHVKRVGTVSVGACIRRSKRWYRSPLQRRPVPMSGHTRTLGPAIQL